MFLDEFTVNHIQKVESKYESDIRFEMKGFGDKMEIHLLKKLILKSILSK